MLQDNRKLLEADIFDTDAFSDPTKVAKVQGRIRALRRAMSAAEKAIETATQNGQLSKAKELTDRLTDLEDLIDNQEREIEEAEDLADTEDADAAGAAEDTEDADDADVDQDEDMSDDDDGADGDSEEAEDADDDSDADSEDTDKDSEADGEEDDASGDSEDGEESNNSDASEGDSDKDADNDSSNSSSSSDSDKSDSEEDNNSSSSSGDIGDENDSESDEYNPFEMDPNAVLGKGGKPKNAKDPSLETIIKLLKKLSGDGRRGALDALKEILRSRGYDDTDIPMVEALKPIPKKSLADMSDDEFNDMLNNLLDEIDDITPLPFVDQDEREKRISKIQQTANDTLANRELEIEDNVNLQKDRAALKAREKELDKYRSFKSINQFEINFWRAIKDQVDKYEEEEETPTRINRQYDGEDVIKKGFRSEEKYDENKPSVDLYFDMSGSWTSNTEAVEIGKRAVAAMTEFVDRDEIILNVYYFSNDLATDINDSCLGGGTHAWDKIIAQIKANDAKNVVLMTDSDMDWQAESSAVCRVEGCVWIIWRDGDYSENIVKKLRGDADNEQYSFNSSN